MLWFYCGYSVIIVSFIIILIYLILLYINVICHKNKKHQRSKSNNKLNLSRIIIYIGMTLSIILVLTCIVFDFLHLLFPLILPAQFPCGIRDGNFSGIRVVADFAQFWGYIIFWFIMTLRLINLFIEMHDPLTLKTKLALGIFFIIDIIITILYNTFQVKKSEKDSIDELLFGLYLGISVLLNLYILCIFSQKLLSLHEKKIKRKQDNEIKKQDPIFYMTQYIILFGLQLLTYMIRYTYRTILAELDTKFEKYQILWILSYTLRDVMCVFMVMAIYYNFSEVSKQYDKTYSCCHRYCSNYINKISQIYVNRQERIVGDQSMTSCNVNSNSYKNGDKTSQHDIELKAYKPVHIS